MKNQTDVQEGTPKNESGGVTIACLLAGLGIGAAMSLLLAPKSGAETRRWIANKCLDGVDSANRSVRHTRRQMKDLIDQGQKKINDVVEAGREAVGKA